MAYVARGRDGTLTGKMGKSFDCKVKVQLVDKGAQMPRKAFPGDACYDLYMPCEAMLKAGQTALFDLGIRLEIPSGWEAQIRGRSGLAKRGVFVHFGTIDHLYRKNVGVIIFNSTAEDVSFARGDRVAQMKLDRIWEVELGEGVVEDTERGGFGSTGN